MLTMIMSNTVAPVLVSLLAVAISTTLAKIDNDPMIAEEDHNMISRISYQSDTPQPTKSTMYSYLNQPSAHVSFVTDSDSLLRDKKHSLTDDEFKKSASEYYHSEMPGSINIGHEGEYRIQHPTSGYDQAPSYHGYNKGKEIMIKPDHKPITLHYRTQSQPIVVHQTRIPGPKPEVKRTKSHEEPHRVVHEVIRPIIQEVHEIIQPYRRVVQQVQPVIEEVRTVVAKSADKQTSPVAYSNHGRVNQYTGPMQLDIRHPGRKTPMFRKAAVFESDDTQNGYESMMMPTNQITRGKVYINKKGIPVYQAQYMGPVYMSS